MLNYRLTRARRIIENSFSILANRWRIFRQPIIAKPERAVINTKAAIALHNYLRTTESSVYCPPIFVDAEDGTGNIVSGSWRVVNQLQDLFRCHKLEVRGEYINSWVDLAVGSACAWSLYFCHWIRYLRSAADITDSSMLYFSSPAGEVDWQYTHVNRTAYV